jgi:sugar-specific transcriptional regulator TrmB
MQKFAEDDINALTALGLNLVQSKIYLTILRHNRISVGDISRITMIRREQVYRSIPKLQEKGLVEKELDKPIKIYQKVRV